VDGSSSKQLFNGLVDPYIALSSTNDKVAFVADKLGETYNPTIFIYDLKSENRVDLLEDASLSFRNISDLTWSPGERCLAFVATIPRKDNIADWVLFIVDLQTSTLKEVARDIRGPLAWAPNGQSIATTLISKTEGIYQVNVEDGKITKLTDDRLATPFVFEWR
jgi:Tol biopolymer transport system component